MSKLVRLRYALIGNCRRRDRFSPEVNTLEGTLVGRAQEFLFTPSQAAYSMPPVSAQTVIRRGTIHGNPWGILRRLMEGRTSWQC